MAEEIDGEFLVGWIQGFLCPCHHHAGLLCGGARAKGVGSFHPLLDWREAGMLLWRRRKWMAGWWWLDLSFGCVTGNLLQGLIPHCPAGNKWIFIVSKAEEHLRSLCVFFPSFCHVPVDLLLSLSDVVALQWAFKIPAQNWDGRIHPSPCLD